MNAYWVYGIAVVGNILLYNLSGEWYGAEWIFGLLIIGVFAFSLEGWKRYSKSGIGLVFLTAFGLFILNSIFYLLAPAIYTVLGSLLFGLVLILCYRQYHSAVFIAWWLVWLNIMINFELANEVIFWFTFITAGIGVLVGVFRQSALFTCFFTVWFFAAGGSFLMMSLLLKTYRESLFAVFTMIIVALGAYLLKSKTKENT